MRGSRALPLGEYQTPYVQKMMVLTTLLGGKIGLTIYYVFWKFGTGKGAWALMQLPFLSSEMVGCMGVDAVAVPKFQNGWPFNNNMLSGWWGEDP